VHAYLPTAKKPYNARVALQTELTLEEIAEKAEVYNIDVSPARIVEGTNAFFTLCCYLAADGFKLKTPLFNSYIRIPGEYEGYETHLPEGVHPAIRMEVAADFREYIRERVKVMFDGIDETNGFIGDVLDEETGSVSGVITMGNIIDIRGSGLKIMGDEEHADEVGLFFQSETSDPIRATIIPVNEPKMLKVLVPMLTPGQDYVITIRTQSSAKHASSIMLKNIREMKSDFTVTPSLV
jgi:hypothetical protein